MTARRRWGRKDKHRPDASDASENRPSADAAPDDGPGDLAERLAAVTSQYARPPTADELRAAFGCRTPAPPTDPPPTTGTFSSTYTPESLFTATANDEIEEERFGGDDRSRTTGDYFYDPDDAWAVLGLPRGASWGDIAAAHRRMAKLHHPDRLHDATPEQQARSEETMREVNVAYSVLRRLTGH